MNTVCKVVFDAQFSHWGNLFFLAILGGFWMVPAIYLAVPDNLPFKGGVIAVAAMSGGVAAFVAFFVGMAAGARLPK